MSLSPPPPEKSKLGDVWVDPFDARRYIYTGEDTEIMWGWKPWDLANEKFDYEATDA